VAAGSHVIAIQGLESGDKHSLGSAEQGLAGDQVAQRLEPGHMERVLEGLCPPSPGFRIYYPARTSEARSPVPMTSTVFSSSGATPEVRACSESAVSGADDLSRAGYR
jgi:hypothetical protein